MGEPFGPQTRPTYRGSALCREWGSRSGPRLGLSTLEHLQVHAQGPLDGVFSDEAHKVGDVSFPVGQQLVNGLFPHHGLGDLSGMV